MRYGDEDRESRNVEDRRGQRGPIFRFPMGRGMGRGGRGVRIPLGKGGGGLTTILIIGALLLLFGINPLDLLTGGGGQRPQIPQMPQSSPDPGRTTADRTSPLDIPGLPGSGGGVKQTEDDMKQFVARVLADTEDVWHRVFRGFNRQYREPKMVLFTGATQTACGVGVAAMGPFYCPIDQQIYIDLAFYDELKRRFAAPGDFAQAYVIAHEVGHHVQKQLGIADRVQELKSSMDQRSANALQVRMELQADCLAGVWANLNDQLKDRLQPGDVKEGLNAASQIGDDMMQRRVQGRVVPDAFTHGSSEQRVRWFRAGLDSGNIQSCDTFNARDL